MTGDGWTVRPLRRAVYPTCIELRAAAGVIGISELRQPMQPAVGSSLRACARPPARVHADARPEGLDRLHRWGPMVDASDELAWERRLDAVHERVIALDRRVAGLELRLQHSESPPAPHRAQAVVVSAAVDAVPSAGSTLRAPIVVDIDRGPRPESRPASPTRKVAGPRADDAPIVPLSIAGGSALLLGMALFAWHAMEQAWIGPDLRLLLGAIAAVVLTGASWPLAKRGHIAVAGAVGGAGLGAWFAAWLVARHAHDLVSAPQAFAALAAGAIACLALGGRLRLRLMAGLACMAACATPALTATGADRLGELMIYQLSILVVLGLLDKWRTWPELPSLGLAGTWLLAVGWAEAHLGPHNAGAAMAWAAVLMVATVASTWRLSKTEAGTTADLVHIRGRLVLSGLVSWVGVVAASGGNETTLATGFAALAMWHGALAAVAFQRKAPSVAKPLLWLGWMQAMVIPPVMFDDAAVAIGWGALAVAAVVWMWLRENQTAARMLVVPTLCTAAWSLAHAEASWAMAAGLAAAAVPLLGGLWPRKGGEPNELAVRGGTAVWFAVVWETSTASMDIRFVGVLAPVVLVALVAIARPRPKASVIAITHLLVVLAAGAALVWHTGGFATGPMPSMVWAAMVGLGLLTAVVVARSMGGSALSRWSEVIDLGGVVVAGFFGIALAIVAPRLLVAFPEVGRTASIALVGLALVIVGLRADRAAWRQLGLASIAVAAAKIVVLDTAGTTLAGRALSFVGIGAVLIVGAYAYSRAQRRRERVAESGTDVRETNANPGVLASDSLACGW